MQNTTEPPQSFTRDDIVRAVLGQQWAVALALHVCALRGDDEPFINFANEGPSCRLAALPSPVEVVAQIWGGE